MQVFDKTLKALQTSNHMRELRQNIISGNIANAETPGFQAQKLDFEGELQSALAQGDMNALDGGLAPQIYDNPEGEMSIDGNTVDMQQEMSAMLENNLAFRTATQLINKKLAALKYAATDGGR